MRGLSQPAAVPISLASVRVRSLVPPLCPLSCYFLYIPLEPHTCYNFNSTNLIKKTLEKSITFTHMFTLPSWSSKIPSFIIFFLFAHSVSPFLCRSAGDKCCFLHLRALSPPSSQSTFSRSIDSGLTLFSQHLKILCFFLWHQWFLMINPLPFILL